MADVCALGLEIVLGDLQGDGLELGVTFAGGDTLGGCARGIDSAGEAGPAEIKAAAVNTDTHD